LLRLWYVPFQSVAVNNMSWGIASLQMRRAGNRLSLIFGELFQLIEQAQGLKWGQGVRLNGCKLFAERLITR